MAKVKPSIIVQTGTIGDRVYYTRFGKQRAADALDAESVLTLAQNYPNNRANRPATIEPFFAASSKNHRCS